MGLFSKDCAACGGTGKVENGQSMLSSSARRTLPHQNTVDQATDLVAQVTQVEPGRRLSAEAPAPIPEQPTQVEPGRRPSAEAPAPIPEQRAQAQTTADAGRPTFTTCPPPQEPPSVAPVKHERIAQLLSDRPNFKAKVKRFHDENAREGLLDLQGLRKFCAEVGSSFDVPASAFGDLEDAYARFDFDGSGALDLHESYCCVKACLTEYRKSVGLTPAPSVPFMTPEQGGYTVIRVLASGGQGTASLVRDLSGNEVVLKTYSRENENAGGLEELIDESEHMRIVNKHDHVAHCLNIFQDKESLYMISGANVGGDWQRVQQHAAEQGVSLTEDWYRTLFRQAFEGLSHMHGHAIMHCDIKEPNLMLKTHDYSQPNVVIIDLGLSQTFPLAQGVCGTPGYIPPETWSTEKWFPKGDIFSMGVVCLQLLTGKIPAEEGDVRGIFTEGCQGMEDVLRMTRDKDAPLDEAKTASGPASTELREVLGQCLRKDRSERPRAPQVLAHPWFAGAMTYTHRVDAKAATRETLNGLWRRSSVRAEPADDDDDSEPSTEVPMTPAQATAKMLPPGPRICVLGGTKFQDPATEALVAAVAERLAGSLAGKIVVLTGGMPGVQAAFAEAFGPSQSLVHLLPEGQASGFAVGRDVPCGATLDERMEAFGLLGDVYLTFEGGPGVAREAKAAFGRGALVLPMISTGGASAGMFDFPSSALVKPASVTEAQWACLTEKVSPKQAAFAVVDMVTGSLEVVAVRKLSEDGEPAKQRAVERQAAGDKSARDAEAAGGASPERWRLVAAVAVGLLAAAALRRMRRRR